MTVASYGGLVWKFCPSAARGSESRAKAERKLTILQLSRCVLAERKQSESRAKAERKQSESTAKAERKQSESRAKAERKQSESRAFALMADTLDTSSNVVLVNCEERQKIYTKVGRSTQMTVASYGGPVLKFCPSAARVDLLCWQRRLFALLLQSHCAVDVC